jgi:putrescine transport system permease protein
MTTLWIAHVTFCAAFVAVVITSRLREMDVSIEEAVMEKLVTTLPPIMVGVDLVQQ